MAKNHSDEEMDVSSPGNIDTESESESEQSLKKPPVTAPKNPQREGGSYALFCPKRLNPLHYQMAKNHSNEEMDVSSPGNTDTESESESEQPPKKPPVTAPKNPHPQDSSSSKEESDSKSEPDLDPKTQKPNPVVKRISSKPIDGPEKPRSKADKGPVGVIKVEYVTASKEKINSGDKDNGDLVVVNEEKQSAELEKNVEVKAYLNLIACGKSVTALEKWLEENSGVLSVEKRNEMKEKWESLKVAEADLCLRRMELIGEQAELMRQAMRDAGIDI